MKKTQELTLKIEDLEERIAPHLSFYLPETASEMADPFVNNQSGMHHASLGATSLDSDVDFRKPSFD